MVTIILVPIMIILFLLPKTQNYNFLLSFYQQNSIKNHQNFLVKDLKDQYIGMNVKQKAKLKI